MMVHAAAAMALASSAEGPIVAVMLMSVLAAGVWLLTPLVRALARRLEGRAAGAHLTGEVEDLRARVQELEAQQGRMQELEERLDFAERLLVRQREGERERIGPGGAQP
jgi:hypothetical protein